MMTRRLRAVGAITGALGFVVLSVPAAASEALPMPLARYADLCRASGGSITQLLTSGVGMVQCDWPDQGRTDCKVGANQVSACGISCRSNACLKENPARQNPKWPLAGGPGGVSPLAN